MEIVYAVQDDSRLLPLIEEGRDGEFPVWDLLCCHSEQRSKAERDSESLTPPANASYRT